MQLAQQLKAAGLGAFPCALNYDQTKGKWGKKPLTVQGESWAITAERPIDDPQVAWQTGGQTAIGVPVPADVIVIDLDTYVPGCTTQTADAIFGCQIPWQQALIQTTIGGGQHYAFKAPSTWRVKQRDNIGGTPRNKSGVDTRTIGGFICTGHGYTPADVFGVLRMAYPQSLPELPEGCRELLERHEAPAPTGPVVLPDDSERDLPALEAALRHIDPEKREDWFEVGCALKHYFHDDESTGFALFDAWSGGEYWKDGCPAGYAGETQSSQWGTFKPVKEGRTIAIGTLFHKAMQGGWIPPARFDTSAAFGQGAAPVETFNGLVQRINEQGADSRHVEDILKSITTSGCNEIQALLLRNELKAMLQSAKLLDKDMRALIDRATSPQSAIPAVNGLYGPNDTDNAALFLSTRYPNETLIKCDSEYFCYSGKVWEKLPIDALKHQIASDMAMARCQVSRINTCIDLVCKLAPVSEGGMSRLPANKIIFDNGVLDIDTGYLEVHSKSYLTTNILPYNYNPGAYCPEWLAFLYVTLEGDQERIGLLQEWIGYLLTSDYRHHKVMMLLGPRRCGKGTIGRVIQQVVGETNFSGGSLTSFAADSFIDSLRNKPVMFIGDAEKRVAPAKVNQVIERIKSISGNDSVAFDRKFISHMSETLPTRITIATNSVPNLFDDSGALASRLLLLPFNVSFYGREDLLLFNRLVPELSGIAAWALEGLRRLQHNGRFVEPAASQSEMQYISEAYSPLTRFLNEACICTPDSESTTGDLYAVYRVWCLDEGEDILKSKTFVGAIKDATRGKDVSYGVHRFNDGTRGRGFKGIQSAGAVPSTASAFQPKVVS